MRMRVDMDCIWDWYSNRMAESSAAFNEAVRVRADSLSDCQAISTTHISKARHLTRR